MAPLLVSLQIQFSEPLNRLVNVFTVTMLVFQTIPLSLPLYVHLPLIDSSQFHFNQLYSKLVIYFSQFVFRNDFG
jgi:hypothetical protein